MSFWLRFWRITPLLSALVLAGCARLGEQVQFREGAGAPRAPEILDALAANDEAIQSLFARGSFKLKSPEFEAIKMFADGSEIAFRRPADLSVRGRNYIGMEMFRLTSVGSEFLIDFPASKDEPYYRVEGEQFKSVPFSVSPSDIAREMFLPEDWDELRRREARLVEYDAAAQTAVLEIGPRNQPRRRVAVKGPPWVVVKNERLQDGEVLAVTTKSDYRDVGGVRFPAFIDAWFPGEETRLTFKMRDIQPNVELDEKLFDIKSRALAYGVLLQ